MSHDLADVVQESAMSRYQMVAISICLVINMLDGFDVLVMAFTASSVSNEWNLQGSELGVLLSAGLVGMTVGSLFVAPLGDRVGRRAIVLACLVIISLGMFLSACARGMFELAAFRVFTGLGIGGMLASLNVLVAEYSSNRWRSFAVSLLQAGYPIGAVIGGSIAAFLIGRHGWQSVFLFGAITSSLMIPLVLWRLPESLVFLLTKRPKNALGKVNSLLRNMNRDEVSDLPEPQRNLSTLPTAFNSLLFGALRMSTLLLWTAFFMVMFSFYFVLSWTPKLLTGAGFSTEEGISAGVLLNMGGVVGGLLLGYLSSRIKLNKVIAVYMLVTAAAMIIFGLSSMDVVIALTLCVLVGFFLFGSMIGLYALAPELYPASIRATGMGWAIGVGRLGAILSPLAAGVMLDYHWQSATLFVVFSVPLMVSAIVVTAIRNPTVGSKPNNS